jgi:hypothetical protein
MFNGGSDFNEPVRRCLERLHSAAWANSDVLLVSGGAGQGCMTMCIHATRFVSWLHAALLSSRAGLIPLPSRFSSPSCPCPDGELRQPAPAIMRQLSGAKEGLGLRVRSTERGGKRCHVKEVARAPKDVTRQPEEASLAQTLVPECLPSAS